MSENSLLILYGTQTGTAQDVAERIGEEAHKRWLNPNICDLASYDKRRLPLEKIVVFVVSTTGQGDTPDSVIPFWKFLLRKDLPSDSLRAVQFAVFGLGDSSYTYYNVVAKKLHRRLLQLGAQALLGRGDGDDQHDLGFEGALVPWLKQLWMQVLPQFNLETKVLRTSTLPHKYEIEFTDASVPVAPRFRTNSTGPWSERNPFLARLVENRRLTAPGWEQDVRHLKLDISTSGIQYQPGDVVCIQPENPPDLVDEFLQLLGVSTNLVVRKIASNRAISSPKDLDQVIPLPATLRDVLLFHLDFLSVPRLSFYALLARYATNELEKEKLEDFTTPQGQFDLLDYNYRAKRTYLEVLQQFSSARPPLDLILASLPQLRAREFSISSAQIATPNSIDVTMAVVKYRALYSRTKLGLLSNWIAGFDMKKDHFLPIWVKRGSVQLPSPATPIVMVGPGTGCAVFRAFLQHRSSLISQGAELGGSQFFFGCRHSEKDYFYREEFEGHVPAVLPFFDPAFSRDSEDVVYVQHKIRAHGEEVYRAIEAGAVLYFSGNARRIPIDVREAFVDVLRAHGQLSQEQAEQRFASLRSQQRYFEDSWY